MQTLLQRLTGGVTVVMPCLSMDGFSLPMFPVILLAAVGLTLFALARNDAIEIEDKQFALRALPVVLAFAAISGRGLYVAVTSHSMNEAIQLFIRGGSVFYGCLLGGAVGLLVACRHAKKSVTRIGAMYATYVPLAQAVGRLGCYLNGCCYGIPYEGILAVPYVVNGIPAMVFPTWFVESTGCFAVFLMLLLSYGEHSDAQSILLYLGSYASLRFFVEFFRGMRCAALLAPVLFLKSSASGLLLLWQLLRCVKGRVVVYGRI